jgi:putative PIN family toxin of toxin-antitoxin system
VWHLQAVKAPQNGYARGPMLDPYAPSTAFTLRHERAPCAVIDTQVVMDWLVFDEPSVADLVRAIELRQIQWLATSAMKGELLHVLSRGVAASRHPDLVRIERAFSAWCQIQEAHAPRVERLICRDPDDQMFIDLAVASHCNWLISRDRAVLALAKRARAFGLEIVKPEAWAREWLIQHASSP